MTVEEALDTYWLKSYHRPIRELLDNGYLTKERLEWAGQNSYVGAVKEASQVLLSSWEQIQKILQANISKSSIDSFDVGISIEQARTVLWPMAPYKNQPMGELVDTKQLTLRELGFGIEKAYDQKVRKASAALLLSQLGQAISEPVPSVGGVHIIWGKSKFSRRKQMQLAMLIGYIGGLGIALMAACYFYLLLFGAPMTIVTFLLGLLLIFLWYKTMDIISDRIFHKIDNHRHGEEGEDRTVHTIIEALDGNWHLFRNLTIPGEKKGDMDLVLVGPPGIWLLEVKNYRGRYRNSGELWEYQSGKEWKKASVSPTRQAKNGASNLQRFLKANKIDSFVNPVVIWANEDRSVSVKTPTVPVWTISSLADELGNIWQKENLSLLEREKIVTKLSELAEKR